MEALLPHPAHGAPKALLQFSTINEEGEEKKEKIRRKGEKEGRRREK